MLTRFIVGRGRTGPIGCVGGVGGGVSQVVATLGGIRDIVETAGVVLIGTHVRVGRAPTAASARRVLLVGVVAAVGSCGHREGRRLLRLVEAADVAAARASATTAWGLLVLVVRAGGRNLGRVHISHQTVKDSSHPGPGRERAGVAATTGGSKEPPPSLLSPPAANVITGGGSVGWGGKQKKCGNGTGNSSSGAGNHRAQLRTVAAGRILSPPLGLLGFLPNAGSDRGRQRRGGRGGGAGPGIGRREELSARSSFTIVCGAGSCRVGI